MSKKNILLGVTGGIAAYKTISLCSQLVKKGFNVKVILTKNATQFVTPLPYSTITGNPVYSSLWTENGEIPHIDLAEWADLTVIAPATASIISKCAHGNADDLLSSTILALKSPLLIVPAMNVHMLSHPATQANLYLLHHRGYFIMEPDSGNLACGYSGKGRYPENEEIIYYIRTLLEHSLDLLGKKVLVTAGACQESIDPMRYITNHSSGKMGLALARSAHIRGAKVTLIHAAIKELIPSYLDSYQAITAKDMLHLCLEKGSENDFIIMAAAVSDYKPEKVEKNKIKKGDNLQLSLIRTKDIVSELSIRRGKGQKICGFAAESENLIENARQKLKDKNLDCIIANDLKVASASNTVCHFIAAENEIELVGDKFNVAGQILTFLQKI